LLGHPMSRRRFGLVAAGGFASLALPGGSPHAEREVAAPSPPRAASGDAVAVALEGVPRGAAAEAVGAAVRRAALAASDFAWLSRGDTVLIKPVCNSGNAYPATTDPVALRAMIELLRERGAKRVLVADMAGVEHVRFSADHLSGSTRQLMANNRLAQACEAAGGELHAFEEQGWDGFYEERPSIAGSWSQPIMMPKLLHEVDHVVLMPRCGRHLLAGSTLGLKAAVGWWRHDTRFVYHREGRSLPEKTAESNTVPSLLEKQRLVLTSATRVMTTFGPDEGYVLEPELGAVIASASLVAHDMVSLAWLLESRRLTPETKRDGTFEDPYSNSALMVNLANRAVTGLLGGFWQAFRAEGPPRPKLATIWDDLVLRRAFDVFGGVPSVELVGAPEPLREVLAPALRG